MKITQLASILNEVLPETLGTQAVALEDLSNVVDIGRQLNDLDGNDFDRFMKKLPDRIGRTIFVDRPYSGRAPSLMMEAWEYGSILMKIRSELPERQDNPTWNLQDGQKYPLDEFKAPTVNYKLFNQKDTGEIQLCVARKQVREAFLSAQGVNALFSMLQSWIEKRQTVDRDNLTMRTINTLMGATLNDKNPIRAINILDLYKKEVDAETTLTATTCLNDLSFLKFAAFVMKRTSSRMENLMRIFNIGGTSKATPKSMQKIVLLADFAEKANVYLQSDTFHNEFTKFPQADLVDFWQGSGTDFAFDSVSKIHVTIQNPKGSDTVTVEQTGILVTIFDRDAAAICNMANYTTSFFNPHGEFETMWYKNDYEFLNDYDENCVVFYVADAE